MLPCGIRKQPSHQRLVFPSFQYQLAGKGILCLDPVFQCSREKSGIVQSLLRWAYTFPASYSNKGRSSRYSCRMASQWGSRCLLFGMWIGVNTINHE